MNKNSLKRLAAAILIGSLSTGFAAAGLFYRADNMASDNFFQQPQALNGNVFIIGIDTKSLEALGPFQTWERDIMAKAIAILNQNPEERPAAIGVDVLFTGYTEPKFDDALVKAAGASGNVVAVSMANFSSELVVKEDLFYIDNYHIKSMEEPFPELKAVTHRGHINAMYDQDGIVRHSIYEIESPEGEKVPSFSKTLAELFFEANGMEGNGPPPRDSRNNWYVPFSGEPGAYNDSFSVIDLLNGELPTSLFANSVVLIGPYAPGLMDYITTSIDHTQLMYGVEYQANVIDALISGEFKKEVSEKPQLLFLFLIAFLSVMIFYDGRLKLILPVWIIFTIGYLGVAKVAFYYGYVLHVIWIPIVVTVVFIGSVGFNYVRATLEKRRVTNTFKRYVAPEVVNEILKEGQEVLELGGKLTDIAVLFVDIRGFTTMSENLSATEVVRILNKYLSLTSACIMNNGGTLDKFIGDATMAIFNAPLPQEDYIYKAVKSALDMVEGAKGLQEELMATFGKTLYFGIGIHCGKAVVGNIGANIRMDYTAIGDTVNTAARLESNAPGGQILISRAVTTALSGRIITTSLGNEIKLKGKSEGFEVLRLEGIAEGEERCEESLVIS